MKSKFLIGLFMSLVATITGAGNALGHEIEYNTRALDIKLTVTEPDNYANAAAFIAAIDEIEIEVNKQTKNGVRKVLQRGLLVDYLELAQANGGLLVVNAAALGAPFIQGRVELSDFGALMLDDKEKFVVNFYNVVPTGSGNEVLQILVHSLDDELTSDVHNVYEVQDFRAGSAREINVRDAKVLAIKTADCQEIELLYPNGRRVQYLKHELQALQEDKMMVRNLQHLAAATQINQLNRSILVPLQNALVAKITAANATNVLVLKYGKIA